MKKIVLLSLFLVAVLGFAGGAQAYSVVAYSSYADWLNAISPAAPIVENFENAALVPGFSITEVNGAGSIHDGVYENWVNAGANRYQIFNYAPGMFAWGGWFDLAGPGGSGSSIDVYINDDSTFVFNIPNTAAGQFYGFTANGTFTGVKFVDGLNPAGWRETYYSIDMALASVPEPTTMLLLGISLVGLAGIGRKMK